MSRIKNKVAFVTGANRGMGREFVTALLAAGAEKVYAAARNIDALTDLVERSNGRVVAVELDVSKAGMIEKTADSHKDVELLINNAGIATFKKLVGVKDDTFARAEMDVNYHGTANMTRSFSPVLANNGGGVVVNMISITGLVNIPVMGSYSASKAAVHSLTQCARAELASQGTLVVGAYPGPVGTDMGKNMPVQTADPKTVVLNILQGLEAGEEDIFPDPMSQKLQNGLKNDSKAVEKQLGSMLGS